MKLCQRLAASLLLAALALSVRAEWHTDTQSIMGTRVSATLWHLDAEAGKAALAAVMTEMRRLDAALSPYKTDSELYRLNQTGAAGPVSISAELQLLLERALHYSRLSDGAFDISFASLGQHFDYRNKRQPSPQQRAELLAAVDYRMIVLDRQQGSVSFKHPQLRIDLGGIAKGYAVDRAIELLRARGIGHATVSAGGDSRVLGDKRGRPWVVGVQNPRAEAKMSVLLPLIDLAVSTSGDYERYFIDEQTGERVHHILDPGSGQSASGVISVSILGPRGLDTDPLSTTVFVLGLEKGMQLLQRLPGFDGVIVDADGQVHYSEGLLPSASTRPNS